MREKRRSSPRAPARLCGLVVQAGSRGVVQAQNSLRPSGKLTACSAQTDEGCLVGMLRKATLVIPSACPPYRAIVAGGESRDVLGFDRPSIPRLAQYSLRRSLPRRRSGLRQTKVLLDWPAGYFFCISIFCSSSKYLRINSL